MIVYTLIFGVCAYLVWGITHHWHKKDLHLKVVLEYLGIAILGFAIIMTVIKNL
ncbi:hypothetical protein HZB78_04170 [Candidatus Collierbacteria bacterium]|nr:hypothetical protein [Candidatus Collierbacteria bacterium]